MGLDYSVFLYSGASCGAFGMSETLPLGRNGWHNPTKYWFPGIFTDDLGFAHGIAMQCLVTRSVTCMAPSYATRVDVVTYLYFDQRVVLVGISYPCHPKFPVRGLPKLSRDRAQTAFGS